MVDHSDAGSIPATGFGLERPLLTQIGSERLRRSIRHVLEDVLRDYPKLFQYIKKREEEIENPTMDDDENVGGGRAENKRSDPVANLVITINDDRRLQRLKLERQAIDECLDETGEVTVLLIQKLYFDNYTKRTIPELCDQRIIPVGTTRAYELRNAFLEKLAQKLDIDVM